MGDFRLSQQWQNILAIDADLGLSATQVFMGSDFVLQWGERYPDRAKALVQSGDLQRVYAPHQLAQQLQHALADCHDEAVLHARLRQFRQREMVRIIWRDLAGWADLSETMADMSAMAEVCIEQALSLLFQWQCQQFGTPLNEEGQVQSLVVLGMGKLGARELNLSSDIDLILCYPEEGETQGGRRTLSHSEFFIRLGRKLIQALDTVTEDGFVFRVDMRLRPFGDVGALALSFDAMEEYYQTQGREWERYALIKARAITGQDEEKAALMQRLRPFVYRRYLDYGVFESLREMKAMIAAQLHRKGMDANIKLGAGGIREIEFIGQVFQLIYGGRDKALQQRAILPVLDLLAQRRLLTHSAASALKEAYIFLRRTEHRLQAWKDRQTHVLPEDDDGRRRLAALMGYTDWRAYFQALTAHRQQVQNCFEQVLNAPQRDAADAETATLLMASEEEKQAYLRRLGFADPVKSAQLLQSLSASSHYRSSGEISRARLNRLLPLLVQAVSQVVDPDTCLARILALIDTILQRSAYLSLLIENPLALSQLVKLCAASAWISRLLSRYPVLLDELLDPRALYEVADREQQQVQLQQWLASTPADHLERQMDVLREFKQMNVLHVAAADIMGQRPVMQVGNDLSQLAEVLLEQVMTLAWHYLVQRHGLPRPSGDRINNGFIIVAYGKLGGRELGYGSDLDLVFLYDDRDTFSETTGDKPIPVTVFYTRLAQRMIHILNTFTSNGVLYEIDTRLRPNGQAGLLVSPLSSFQAYQLQEAWVWEHQALVRARSVVGDHAVAERFNSIRCKVLMQKREQTVLASEVRRMRVKMRNNLDTSDAHYFDLKQGLGGITDIEFLVQYGVLAWSSDLPELRVYTDNIRLIEALALTGKLSGQEAQSLSAAYRYFRERANHCVLQDQPARAKYDEVAGYRQNVMALWQRWLA